MEFKGTKGKWEVEFDTENLIKYVKSEHIYIAKVGFGNEEKQANALLISKAPEMLDMLNYLYANDLLKDNANKVLELIKQATEL